MENSKLAETVTAAQNGDETALEALYLAYAKKVYYAALKIMRDKEDAEDITQEVFLAAFEKINDLKDARTFAGWLNRITANKCADVFRRRGKFSDSENFNEVDFIEETDPLLIPEKSIDDAETARLIVEIVDSLPDPQRLCVYYYYYEQLTVAQIAEILAANENAVKQRLYLARNKIRKELERLNSKDGIKLFSAAPLILTPILKMPLQSFEMPPALAHGLWGKITASLAAKAAIPAAAAAAGAAKGAAVAAVKTKIALAAGGVLLAGGITAGIILNPSTPPADSQMSFIGVWMETGQIQTLYYEIPPDNRFIDEGSSGAAECYQAYFYYPDVYYDDTGYLPVDNEAYTAYFAFEDGFSAGRYSLDPDSIRGQWESWDGKADFFEMKEIEHAVFTHRVEMKNDKVHRAIYFTALEAHNVLVCHIAIDLPLDKETHLWELAGRLVDSCEWGPLYNEDDYWDMWTAKNT